MGKGKASTQTCQKGKLGSSQEGIILEPKMSFHHPIPTNSWVTFVLSQEKQLENLIDLCTNVLQVFHTKLVRLGDNVTQQSKRIQASDQETFPDVKKTLQMLFVGSLKSKTLCGASLPDRQPCQWALLDNFSNYLGGRSPVHRSGGTRGSGGTVISALMGLRVGDFGQTNDIPKDFRIRFHAFSPNCGRIFFTKKNDTIFCLEVKKTLGYRIKFVFLLRIFGLMDLVFWLFWSTWQRSFGALSGSVGQWSFSKTICCSTLFFIYTPKV